jgi:hypothetical protein
MQQLAVSALSPWSLLSVTALLHMEVWAGLQRLRSYELSAQQS